MGAWLLALSACGGPEAGERPAAAPRQLVGAVGVSDEGSHPTGSTGSPPGTDLAESDPTAPSDSGLDETNPCDRVDRGVVPATGVWVDDLVLLTPGAELVVRASAGCGLASPDLGLQAIGLGELLYVTFDYTTLDGQSLGNRTMAPWAIATRWDEASCTGLAYGLGWPLEPSVPATVWCPWHEQDLVVGVTATSIESGESVRGEVGPVRVVLEPELLQWCSET